MQMADLKFAVLYRNV